MALTWNKVNYFLRCVHSFGKLRGWFAFIRIYFTVLLCFCCTAPLECGIKMLSSWETLASGMHVWDGISLGAFNVCGLGNLWKGLYIHKNYPWFTIGLGCKRGQGSPSRHKCRLKNGSCWRIPCNDHYCLSMSLDTCFRSSRMLVGVWQELEAVQICWGRDVARHISPAWELTFLQVGWQFIHLLKWLRGYLQKCWFCGALAFSNLGEIFWV